MKNNRISHTTILSTIVCLLPVIAGIVLYSKLPDVMPTHWGSDGQPNGWHSKFVAAIVFPGILVLVNAAMPFLLKMDPKYDNIDEKIKHLIQWIIPVVNIFCGATTLAAGFGKTFNMNLMGSLLLGVVFIVIGNYLPKTKQSYTVGIKIPWTLHDEENWNKTHRMAGFLWVIGGLFMIISGVMGFGAVGITVAAVIMIVVPMVYSYLLYKKNN